MTALAKTVLEDAMKLPEMDRAELANELWESLAPLAPDNEEADPGAEAAWDAEVDRRIAEIDSGKVKGLTREEVMERLRVEFKWDR